MVLSFGRVVSRLRIGMGDYANVDSVMSLNRFQICVRGDFQHFASFISQAFDDVLSDDVRSCCLSVFFSGVWIVL